jgi:sodium transport system permease protein
MGPAVVLLVLFARTNPDPAAPQRPWTTMAAVFAVMAAFTGAMSVATDMVAGERERRSLLPLLVSACSRRSVIIGKWLAASLFAWGSLLINVAAFGLVFAWAEVVPSATPSVVLMAPALLMLALLASALEILISTVCRNTKEANTYLSMVVFAVMAGAMWLGFRPEASQGWLHLVPLAGQQRLLGIGFAGGPSSLVQTATVAVESALLTWTTAAATALALVAAGSIFQRDEAVYGG